MLSMHVLRTLYILHEGLPHDVETSSSMQNIHGCQPVDSKLREIHGKLSQIH